MSRHWVRSFNVFRTFMLLCVCACAATPRQYTLHVDLANQENTVLCEHDVEAKIKVPGDGESAPQDTECPRYGNRPLDAPATLTIKLANGSKGATYDLRVKQLSREASKGDVTALLSQFSSNATNLIRGAAKGAEGDGLVDRVLEKAVDEVKTRAPKAAAALLAKSKDDGDDDSDGEEADDRTPEQKFRRYIDEQAKAFRPSAKIRDGGVTDANEPPNATPPPRDSTFTPKDLSYLQDAFGLNADRVADFVVEWCSAESFVPVNKKNRYADLLAREPRISDLSALFKLDRSELTKIVVGRGDMSVLDEKREALIDNAENWDTASSEAKEYYLMRLGTNLAFAIEHCTTNLVVLEKVASAGKRAELDKTRQGLALLSTAAEKWSGAFVDAFAPLMRDASTITEKTVELADASMSTTLSLEPGELEFAVGQTDTNGKHEEIATFKSHIKGVERLAIVLGPVATFCSWGCFDVIEEIVEQPSDPMMAGRRTLQKTRSRYDLAVATALHYTLLRHDDWGFGPLLGYPLGAADETSTNVLVGFGARHSSGFELAVGVHGLRAPELKDAYGSKIDLELDGNQGLTVDSVTTEKVKMGAFLLIAFAPNVSK